MPHRHLPPKLAKMHQGERDTAPSDYRRAGGVRSTLHNIIFGYDSPAGAAFDIVLIVAIVASVGAVMLDSIHDFHITYGHWLRWAEWIFTAIFTVEYLIRLFCHPRPLRYARSFYGLVDLASTLPTYLALLFPGATQLAVFRLLRVLRVFRILKMARYSSEASLLGGSLARSRPKILVFLFSVTVLMVIFGSLMYVIEGPEHGFSSIPESVYWAVVTITTVGYGDITPQTPLGQAIATLAMLTGYAIIAVPTGIITAQITADQSAAAQQLANSQPQERMGYKCPHCGSGKHHEMAHFCHYCGNPLETPKESES